MNDPYRTHPNPNHGTITPRAILNYDYFTNIIGKDLDDRIRNMQIAINKMGLKIEDIQNILTQKISQISNF